VKNCEEQDKEQEILEESKHEVDETRHQVLLIDNNPESMAHGVKILTEHETTV